MKTSEFVEKYCMGKQYDSCISSPCMYSSSWGCRHPDYPGGSENLWRNNNGYKRNIN